MNSLGDESERKGKDHFEEQLKEILCSGPENKIDDNYERSEKSLLFHTRAEKRLSSSAEIIIRIVAALLVVGLLISFGIQIAFR